MYELQLFGNGKLQFRKTVLFGLDEAIAEAKDQMRKFDATGGRVVRTGEPPYVAWEAGFCPAP